MLTLGACIYLIVGLCLVVVGPAARSLSDQVSRIRGSDLANALTSREKVPDGKLLAFRLTLSIVFALLWPLILVSVLREKTKADTERRAWKLRVESGIEFSRMGGAGAIHCSACGFEQDLVSFTHGYTDDGERCCHQSCQCLSCGKFIAVHGIGEPAHFTVTSCECGGEFSRDHVLFCPKCRSRDLRYDMHFIT